MSESSWNAWFTLQETTTRFIIVRHPFDRLVSAFTDKIERNNLANKKLYYNLYGKEIVRLYRKEFLSKFGSDSLSQAKNYGAILPVTKGERTPELPTFWEFIQWFLRNKKSHANEHWTPMVDYCSVCALNYNYILKFEDFAEDNLEFTRSANLIQYLPKIDFHQQVNQNHQIPSAEKTSERPKWLFWFRPNRNRNRNKTTETRPNRNRN